MPSESARANIIRVLLEAHYVDRTISRPMEQLIENFIDAAFADERAEWRRALSGFLCSEEESESSGCTLCKEAWAVIRKYGGV